MPSRYCSTEDLLLVTARTIKGKAYFADASAARDVIQCLYRVQCFNPFLLYAFVVMPDHVHLLIGAKDYGGLVRTIHRWKAAVHQELQKEIWQDRFELELVPPSERLIERILHNPVRRGLSETAEEYPWSSAGDRWTVSELPKFNDTPLLSYAKRFRPSSGAAC